MAINISTGERVAVKIMNQRVEESQTETGYGS